MTSIALIPAALALTRLLVGVVDSGMSMSTALLGGVDVAATPCRHAPRSRLRRHRFARADPSGQAQVSWTVPPTDGDQTITGYRGPGRPNQWRRDRTQAQPVPASDLSAVVSGGSSSGDTYTFAVSGVELHRDRPAFGLERRHHPRHDARDDARDDALHDDDNASARPPPPTLTPTPTTISTTTTGPTTATTPLEPFPHSNVSYPNGAIILFWEHWLRPRRRAGLRRPFSEGARRCAKVDPAKVSAAPAGASLPSSATPRSGVLVFTSPVNGNPEIMSSAPTGSCTASLRPDSSRLTATTRRSS